MVLQLTQLRAGHGNSEILAESYIKYGERESRLINEVMPQEQLQSFSLQESRYL